MDQDRSITFFRLFLKKKSKTFDRFYVDYTLYQAHNNLSYFEKFLLTKRKHYFRELTFCNLNKIQAFRRKG